MFRMIDESKEGQTMVETHSERRLSNHRMINATHVNTRLAISPHDKVDTHIGIFIITSFNLYITSKMYIKVKLIFNKVSK